MRESELLSRIYARSSDLAAAFPQVIVGPGDDCAVLAAPAGARLLLKVDQLIEGRHFVHGTALDLIARKAVARAVSDLAAMAGTPLAGLVAAALPRGFPQEPANQLFEAVSRWARAFGCPLVGGDIATIAGVDSPLMLTMTVVGTEHPWRGAVLRSGAQPGDGVYVTGEIGGAFEKATGGGRHLTFEPRVSEAVWLADTLGADLHAMMDISDGLGVDAGRLAAASGVTIELKGCSVPLHADNGRHASAQLMLDPRGREAVLDGVGSGEDYELLFTVSGERVVPRVCPTTGTKVTRIGCCRAGVARAWMELADGTGLDVGGLGWEHR